MVLCSSHSLEHSLCAMPASILQWRADIGIFIAKLVKYPFKSKYRANVCPRNLNKFYTICCMFLLLLICAGDIELNPGHRETIIPLIIFLFAIGIFTVLPHIIFQNCLYWNLIINNIDSIWLASRKHSSIPTNDESLLFQLMMKY